MKKQRKGLAALLLAAALINITPVPAAAGQIDTDQAMEKINDIGRAIIDMAGDAAGKAGASIREKINEGDSRPDAREKAEDARRMLVHVMVGILKLLASDRERAFSADEVLDSLRGRGFVCAGNLLYAHVARLREALGPAGHFVINERGVGYRLVR